MERDFIGLSSKTGAGTMKEDAASKPKDPVRGSEMQWSFSNKVSALPQLLSSKATQEDRPRKTILNPLGSSRYMTTSTMDAFDYNQKPFLGVIQKNFSIGKQAGNKHGTTVYPMKHFDAHSACRQEARIFSVSNQSNKMSPILQSNLATSGQNMVNSVIKPQPLGSKSSGTRRTPISILPSIGSFVGSTDLRNCSNSKSSATPAQLTIFYAGSVCVYDDISPEKVQAIMLLAGNGSTPIQNKIVSTAQLQPSNSVPSKDDGFVISQSYPSPLPSPLTVTSHTSSQPGEASSTNNELAIMRPVGPLATSSKHLESPGVAGSVGSAATKLVRPVGLPQARKASLVRFLEKRKERVISTSPYYVSKKSPECNTPGSDAVNFSMNSTGSRPLPAIH